MTRILLVEDDAAAAYVTQGGLELLDDYDVSWAKDGQEGWEFFQKASFDVVITDVEMPRMDGYELVEKIRAVNPTILIIMESGKTSPKDVVKGFETGVDYYIKKPFVAEELHVHIQAFVRRSKIHQSTPSVSSQSDNCIQIGNYIFDFQEQTLQLHSEILTLTNREAGILKMLHDEKGSVVLRETILSTFWDETDYFASRSLDVFVSKLRKYLSKDPSIKIENVRGKGLRLIVV